MNESGDDTQPQPESPAVDGPPTVAASDVPDATVEPPVQPLSPAVEAPATGPAEGSVPPPAPTDAPLPVEAATAHGMLHPDVRRQLIERFETWIDRMALGDPPPAGIPNQVMVEASAASDSTANDLYSVVAGLTNLSGEVRLQGRAFKVLADGLAPLSDLPGRVEQLADALATDDGQAEDPAATLPRPTAMVDVLLDLYDRLARGLRNAEAAVTSDDPNATPPSPGLFDRLMGRTHPAPPTDGSADAVRAMRDGYALTLSRLTAALHQWDVEPIGRPGEPFDPRRMVAVDVRPAGDQPPGTVLEVNRSGSAVRGAVLTPAQVTVAR